MNPCGCDPSLTEALADPLVRAVMAADGVDPRHLATELRAVAAQLNRFDRSSPMAGEAEVKYLDGDFRVVKPGAFVRCAVTGAPIPLEELKYWSVDLQEPYASPEAVLRRHHPEQLRIL